MMKSTKWTDLAKFTVELQQFPNGKFGWYLLDEAGEIVEKGSDEEMRFAIEGLISELNTAINDKADAVLFPELEEESLDYDDLAFEGIAD